LPRALPPWRRYPEETDAALALLRLYAATGDRAALDSLVRRLAASPTTDEAALVQGGLNLYGDGLAAPATTLLEAALARNPNDERALSVVVRTYYALGRAAPLAAVARRLIGLQPLSAACARAMAMAWDLAGQADSTARYLALADTGLAWNVTITQFNPGEHSTSLNGYVRNVSARTLPTMTLVFEFLDASGAVTFSEPVAVAALEPGARNLIEIRSEQTGAVAWRYRRE
jgi:tetratricopeptide (TPR) repeat protein